MPELPEVELVSRSLAQLVGGKTIVAAELLRERLAPKIAPEEFSVNLSETRIASVTRRGKHILFELENGKTLIVHLRMSGRFMLLPFENDNPKFTHAVFYLENDLKLIFQDQRHFGFMNLVESFELDAAAELRKLAPEPFSEEFSGDYLRRILKTSARSIKEFLLDQTKVCGLGNIYAAEAMFLARVHPQTPAKDVSAVKARRLHKYIREILLESIEHGSTLNVDPENIDGSYYGGGYENHWRVYDREGKPCPNCASKIKRLKQGGRSSYFCPKCQPNR
jgi:formamidopyrimidine-DNA glycosylase